MVNIFKDCLTSTLDIVVAPFQGRPRQLGSRCNPFCAFECDVPGEVAEMRVLNKPIGGWGKDSKDHTTLDSDNDQICAAQCISKHGIPQNLLMVIAGIQK